MAITLTEIEAILKLRDEMSPHLEAVKGRLGDTGRAFESAEKSTGGFTTAAGIVSSTIGNLASTALTGLLSNLGQSIGKMVDFSGEMVDLSNKTGISTSALQELKFAGEQTGVSLEQITKAVTTMGRNLAGGKEGAADAVAVLGLSMSTLRASAPEEAFYTIADAVRGIQEPMAQAKLMNEIFGRSGVELLPMINDQTASLGQLRQAAQDLGIVINEDAIRSSEALGDQWEVLKSQGMVLLSQLVQPFIPLAVALANTLMDFAEKAMPYVRLGLDLLYAAFLNVKLGIAGFLTSLLEGVAQVPLLGEKLGLVGTGAAYFRTMADDAQKSLDALVLSHVVASPKVQRLTVDLGALDVAGRKAAESAEKEAEAIDKIAGQGALTAAENMAKAIEKHGLAAVIAANGLEKVHETFDKAITVAETRGKTAPQTWVDTAIATLEADKNLNTYIEGIPKVGERMAALDPAKFFKDLAAATNAELPKVLTGLPGFIADAATQVGDGATNVVAPSFAQSFKAGALGAKGLAGFGKDLGGVIMQAFTGGGNVGEAIGGLLGQTVGKGLNSAFQNMFNAGGPLESLAGSGLGSVLSSAANAVLPGVGAILGAGMTKIFDAVFKTAEKQTNDMRDQFIASAGGLTALNEEAAKAGVTLTAVLDAKKPEALTAAMGELKKAIEAHKQALADLNTDLTNTFQNGLTLTDDLAKKMLTLFQRDPEAAGESIFKFLQGEVTNLTTGFNEAAKAWETTLTGGAAGFQRFATIGVAAFNAATESGLSVPEALAAITPGLNALIKGTEELGTGTGGNAAFDQLLEIAQLSTQFAPLLTQISGLSQMVTSLGNVGLLTQETFAALAEQVGATFQAMIAQGASSESAMRLIQPQLQKLWEAENQFGVETRGATADLLEQGFQAGIVGPQFVSAQDKMVESVNRLVARMSDLITVMTGGTPASLVGAAQMGARGVASAFDTEIPAMPAHDQLAWMGTTLNTWLPGRATEGAVAVNTQLATITAMPARQDVYRLEQHFWTDLPQSARDGVTAVNTSLKDIDVESVQTAVHDIDWEFEQGIPDAASAGVGLVNTSMDVAERAIGEVRGASADVSNAMRFDIPESAGIAGGAIATMATEAVGHFEDIEEAATSAAWGSSPTGIKEIAVAVDKTLPALRLLAQQGIVTFGTIERIAAAAAGTASEELMAVPESASQALWELYAAYDDAIGQMAAIAPEMTWGFQSIADRISDMANEAQSRWDQDWLTPPAPAVSSQDAEYLAQEQAMRERYGEAGLPTEQTIIIQLDGQVLAEQVIEHAPDLIEVFAG